MEIQRSCGCAGGLKAPDKGDGPSQSDGNKIKCLSIFIQGYIAFPEATGDQVREMPYVSISLVQVSQTNGVTINSEDIYQNDIGTARGNLFWKRTMFNTSCIKVTRRKTVSFSNSQQNITSDGDIERTRKAVRFHMRCSFLHGFPVHFLTGNTTADVANVVDNSFHIIAAATAISVAPVIAYTSRMRFVG